MISTRSLSGECYLVTGARCLIDGPVFYATQRECETTNEAISWIGENCTGNFSFDPWTGVLFQHMDDAILFQMNFGGALRVKNLDNR